MMSCMHFARTMHHVVFFLGNYVFRGCGGHMEDEEAIQGALKKFATSNMILTSRQG